MCIRDSFTLAALTLRVCDARERKALRLIWYRDSSTSSWLLTLEVRVPTAAAISGSATVA
eukprot:2025201-Alexandrium_andersonii.AAC.1